MNLEDLKDALGEDAFAELSKYVEDLTGQRDAARRESISGRQSLKSRVAELEAERDEWQKLQADLFSRLGVESADELAALDPKGQAEAAKQYEAKLKRAEKELADRQSAHDALFAKYRGSLQDAALRKALSSHEWIDSDLVESYVRARLSWDDDRVVFTAEDGLSMPLEDGVSALSKVKPHLLKNSGAGGSGYRGKPSNGQAAVHSLTRAQFEALNPAGRMQFFKDGGKLME